MGRVYKIMTATEWRDFKRSGHYTGSPDDHRDGFIHLSDREQVQETARKHFAGKTDLVLVAVAADRLGDNLRYEVSRGGALFPHLYAVLAIDAVVWNRPIETDPAGFPILSFPDETS